MTAFIISGFFSLTSGRRIRTDVPRPNGTTQGVYYVHYDTVVQCSQTGPISAEVRKYSPPGEAVLQDDTIAYVTAKAYMPPPNMPRTLLLEAIHIAPEPGDPTSDSYEESVPDLPFPSVLIHGTVSSEHKVNDGGVVIFPVTVSDYVRGNNKISTIRYDSMTLSTVQNETSNSQLANGQGDTSLEKRACSEQNHASYVIRNMLPNAGGWHFMRRP